MLQAILIVYLIIGISISIAAAYAGFCTKMLENDPEGSIAKQAIRDGMKKNRVLFFALVIKEFLITSIAWPVVIGVSAKR